MKVSIIIPVLNEEENIKILIDRLKIDNQKYITDLLVVDGGSTDRTIELAQCAGASVLKSPQRGRAQQMNFGAQHATGDLLYFVHGDTLPPRGYLNDIFQAVEEGYPIGCFRFRFDSGTPLLRINAFMTRFDFLWCRGGDQTLYVTRALFEELRGYRQDYIIMEEYDFIMRARENHAFKIIPKDVIVSSRKYKANGYFRVQIANFIVFNMFRLGVSQQTMMNTYRCLIGW